MGTKHILLFFWATILAPTVDAQRVSERQLDSNWCTFIGFAVRGTQIRQNHTKSHKECRLWCESDRACESTNYLPLEHLCEMNAASHGNCPRSLVQMADAVYTPTRQTSCAECTLVPSNNPSTLSHLEAHYAFERNVLDSTSAGRHGVDVGGITYSSGVCGKAAYFGGHSKIEVPDFSGFRWGSRFSVSAWFKRTNPDGSQGIVNAGWSALGAWEVGMVNYDLGAAVITTAQHHQWPFNGVTASLNDWHHVVVTYNGSQLSLYADNELHSGDSHCCTGDIVTKVTPVTIGQAGQGQVGQYFFGYIDEVKIFTTTLRPKEVDKMFRFPCTC